MRLAVAGEGAFGAAHLKALTGLGGVETALLIGGVEAATRETAARFGVPSWTTDFDAAIAEPGIDAVILATPTPLHAAQAIACLEAGKHVLVRFPWPTPWPTPSDWCARANRPAVSPWRDTCAASIPATPGSTSTSCAAS